MGFGNFDFKKPNFKKISDVIWEIDKNFKNGMNVPVRVFGSKKILDGMDLQVYDQASNVATLPGIQKYSFVMPDGHSGYGFSIGGVAAMDVENGGVISPGGIGFDINCLHPETKILTKFGCFKKIKDLEKNFSNEKISFMDLSSKKKISGSAIMFLQKKADKPIFKITTKAGKEIILSSDHPLFTGGDFKKAGIMKKGDRIVSHSFAGVKYEEPSNEIIIDEKKISAVVGERQKLIKELKSKGLLPLRYNSPALPILAKLAGFLTGDGHISAYYNKKRKQEVWAARAIGKPEDLEDIRQDIKELGYEANYTTTKQYASKINEVGGAERKINGKSTQLFIVSQSLSVLLHALGVPKGNKSRIAVGIPAWIKKSPLWIKRLYLAGLFGAELTKPAQRKGEPHNFIEPSFSQNKIAALEKDNMNFILEIINLLSEFGVNTNKIYRQRGVVNSYGEETHKLSLRISAKGENLIKLWSTIGYEYCKERKELSALSAAYLCYKQACLSRAKEMLSASQAESTQEINKSALKFQLLKKSKNIRVSHDFPTFEEFCRENKIENSEFVFDRIEEISPIEYDGKVYDLTMADENHNFIADGIVSHNCGMRLLTTNLTYEQVKPHLRELVENLFRAVPAGVGSEGFVKFNKQQFREAIELGSEWCVENGYGWKEDLERTEENGRMKGADATKCSAKSIERGMNQVGTLGSGNHYLEIQVVKPENIFDETAAKAMGIFPNQVVIMFHCGSRGFGHQVATDYLQKFLSVMESKYKIKILDRELACAPFNSPEGQDYFSAMQCAINMSFANRQTILHRIREVFSKVFKTDAEKLEMHQVYDVAHNTAKLETYNVDGKPKKLLVHRKGATRSLGPDNPSVPQIYRKIGQPVIIGGSMETGSYLLVGTKAAEEQTFGSTAHGSGRTMSRTKATRLFRGETLLKDMAARGIIVKSTSMSGLAEEAGAAYKDIDEVINATHAADISRKVVKLIPVGNVKG